MSLPKTFDGHRLGEIVVKDWGICKIVDVDDYAGYTMETIMPKEVFAEAYKKYIIDDSAKEEPKQNKLTEEMITAIWGTLIEAENHDTEKFRLGDTIRYTPDEVADILRMKFKGDTD